MCVVEGLPQSLIQWLTNHQNQPLFPPEITYVFEWVLFPIETNIYQKRTEMFSISTAVMVLVSSPENTNWGKAYTVFWLVANISKAPNLGNRAKEMV